MFDDSNSSQKKLSLQYVILMISISIYLSAPEIVDGDYGEVKSGQWLGAVVYSTGKDGKAMVQHYVFVESLDTVTYA